MLSRVYRYDLCIYGGGSTGQMKVLEPGDLWHDMFRLAIVLLYLVAFFIFRRDYSIILSVIDCNSLCGIEGEAFACRDEFPLAILLWLM